MKRIVTLVVVGLFVSLAYAGEAPKGPGAMIAGQAAMPQQLAELMSAYAEEADAHAAFLAGNKDKNAAAVADGMKKLAQSYRDTAASLTKTADAMKAAAAWPAVAVDHKAMMADAKVKASADKTAALQKALGDSIAKMGAPAAAAPAAPAKK